MKNTVKHIIWSSWINEDEWRDNIKDECEENGIEYDEKELYRMAYELNSDYLEDERINLDIDIPSGIIAIADLGLWNGRHTGYKEIGNNISDCLYYNTDEAEFWVDVHGVFHASMSHHDGTNYVVFKAWKDGVTDEQKENVMDAICCGQCTERMLRRYTRNLGGDIAKVYGWRVSTGKKEA